MAKDPVCGMAVYEQQGCAACHTISGSGGASGPALGGIGRKRDAMWLIKFITEPESIKPKSTMPSYSETLDGIYVAQFKKQIYAGIGCLL